MPHCPHCNAEISEYRNPAPTVDVIIELSRADAAEWGVVLIRRKNPPHGWALPGGFIDYGESAENAARREAKEETGLRVRLRKLLGVYSDPSRDPRRHTISIVYIATAEGAPSAGDDAAEAAVFTRSTLPEQLAFDHGQILEDYFKSRG